MVFDTLEIELPLTEGEHVPGDILEESIPTLKHHFPDYEEPYELSNRNGSRIVLAYASGPRGGRYGIMPNDRAVLMHDGTRKTVPLPLYLQKMLERGEIIFDDDSNR